MKNPFKGRPKVQIQVIKTETLEDPVPPELSEEEDTEKIDEIDVVSESPIKINILGKQQLSQKLTGEELQTAAQQVANEIAQLAVPDIVKKAKAAREAWQIDVAILMLRRYEREFGSDPIVAEELENCFGNLDKPMYFQRVPNGQLANLLFDAAGFKVVEKVPVQERGILELRLTISCQDDDLRRTLDVMSGGPQNYFCYCLAEFDRMLDFDTLQVIWSDFEALSAPNVNTLLHFSVCKGTTSSANMHTNVHRFEKNVITIPLEREETRRAILNGRASDFIQSKVSAWIDNQRLFSTNQPVTREGEFFGRKNILSDITANVKKNQSFHLVGLRRMGKTSLIQHLFSMGAFRNILYAYLDLESHLIHPTFDNAIKSTLTQWNEMFLRRYPKLIDPEDSLVTSSGSSFDNLVHFFERLQHVRGKHRIDLPCLIVFDDVNFLFAPREDEGKKLENLWNSGAGKVLRLLRTRPLVTIIIAAWNLQVLFQIEDDHQGSGGLGKFDQICVQPLNFDECREMISYIGGIINMEFKEGSLEAIYTETGGHPLWTRMLCDLISSKRSNRQEKILVERKQVEEATVTLVNVQERLIIQSLDTLNGEEKVIRDLLGKNEKPLKLEDFSPPVSEQALHRLREYGLVELSDGEYKLRMGLIGRCLNLYR